MSFGWVVDGGGGKRVEDFFQKLADHGRFVERFIVVLQGRDEAARVELEERFGFVVWVDLESHSSTITYSSVVLCAMRSGG